MLFTALASNICFLFVLLHLFYIFNITQDYKNTKSFVDDGQLLE